MTAQTAGDCLVANLELLREATRADTAFHAALDTEGRYFIDVQVARGILATGNPEQLRGQSLDALPWFKSRLAPLRVTELRDTAKSRPDQAEDARSGRPRHRFHPDDRVFINGRAAGLLGLAGARPRDNWEVQLHLLMKLLGSSLATGLERIEIKRICAIWRSATNWRSTAPTTACGISIPSTTASTCRPAGRRCWATTRRTWPGARLAHPGAFRRHVARAGGHTRSRCRQDADFRELASHAPRDRRVALGHQPCQGEGR